jgi:hypothetical protein
MPEDPLLRRYRQELEIERLARSILQKALKSAIRCGISKYSVPRDRDWKSKARDALQRVKELLRKIGQK